MLDWFRFLVCYGGTKSLSRWCYATWVNLLVEKHAWLSAGLIWLPESATGRKVNYVQWRTARHDGEHANNEPV